MKEQEIPFFLMQEPFVIIPFKLITDKETTQTDILVYLAVASYGSWQTGVAFVRQEEIKKRAKFTSTRTIMRTISHLEKIGWATKIKRGLRLTNIIILHAKKNQKVSDIEKAKIREIVEKKIKRWN